MKTYKSTIIALIVLLIVTAGFFLSRSFIFKDKEPAAEEETNRFNILSSSGIDNQSINSNDVVKIESKFIESYIIEKKDKAWVSTSHPSLKVYDISVDSLISSFFNVYGNFVTDDESYVSDLARYGLDNCPYITLYFKNGDKRTLKIGSKSNVYYAIIEGSKKLYTVQDTDAKRLLVTKLLLIKPNVFIVNVQKISNIKRYIKDNVEYELQADFSTSDKSWNMVQPIKIKGDTSKIKKITDAVNSMVFSDIVEENTANLGSYGLEKPNMKLVITDTDNIVQTLEIGNRTTDNESYYCTVNGQKDVYKIYATSLQFLEDSSIDYTYSFAYMVNWKEVESVDITLGDKNYKMEIKVVDNENEIFKFNGKTLTEKNATDQFKSLLSKLYGLSISEVESKIPERGELQIKIVYTLVKNGEKVTVEAYKKDEISSYLFVNGQYIGGYAKSRQIYGPTGEGIVGEIEKMKTLLPE